MSKLAIFAEGLTEQLFVERLIREIAARDHVRIRLETATGRSGDRRIALLSEDPNVGQRGYVLIRDCRGDHNVARDVRDQYQSLVASGYVAIIGLRDIYPRPVSDIPILLGLDRRSLNFGLRTSPIQVKWIFAVMEIEAWFLAEYTHFERLDASLTADRVRDELGFDPRTDDMEARAHPFEDLQSVYRLAGLSYAKTGTKLKRTINALDIVNMYDGMEHVIYLRQLISAIEDFLTSLHTVPQPGS